MIALAWRLAWRDLRGGLNGLLIVLLCLGVGVASVAAIGSLRAALNQGIAQSGRSILGGDLELSTGTAPFPPAVAAWFTGQGALVSETIDTRSILIAPSGRRLLAAVRAVGPDWPLLGAVTSAPPDQFARLAANPPGLLLDATGAASLGLHPGDMVSLGGVKLMFRGTIAASPDSLGDSQLFGVKAFAAGPALAGTALVAPSPLVSFNLQILLPPGANPARIAAAFRHKFPNPEWRLRGAADASADLKRFVDQAALFMTLLSLAALAVGGIGVANGVEAWTTARARTIATLRCLGAPARLVSLIHALQLLLIGVPGILAGIALGAVAPLAVLPWLKAKLPLPAHLGIYPGPLALAGIFGLLVGIVFAIPPLRRAGGISGAALFRRAGLPARVPFSWRAFIVQGLFGAALIALAAISVPRPSLALGFCAGTILVLLLLRAAAWGLIRALRHLPSPRDAAFAFGLRRLTGPASSLPLILLSAGAGLTVLVAVAEIRGNLVSEFSGAIPAAAPSFYFIDIQPGDLPAFQSALNSTHAAHDEHIMPAMRARIIGVHGVPVDQFHAPAQSAWPLRTDIGFTYAATPPPGAKIVQGAWWPADYLGPPLISFDAAIAHDWGLRLGDTITVNVLGRTFDLKIANLRDIHWQNLQLNFLIVGTPDPFAGAPHTLIATVKTDPGKAGDVLAAVTDALPGVTGIDVTQILRSLAGLLGEIGTAVSVVGLVALLAGGLVLISAMAAEREARIAEAVILKTLGATSNKIMRAWIFEFAVAGGAAGCLAGLFGTIAAAITITQVFHTDWHFSPLIMIVTLLASIAAMMGLGFLSTASALRQPAAARLRQETGA
jgi:putative ABC transport system permease protein